MSGSGGGSGGDGDWRATAVPVPASPGNAEIGKDGPAAADPCAILEITLLNSVNAAVLASVKPGDLLMVVYQPGPPQLLLAQTQAGLTVGSITSPSMARLILCIQKGYKYEAQVLGIRGGVCQVRVQPG